jgi:hypothetical protein
LLWNLYGTNQEIKEVTEPLKEEILKGDVHTIEEMKGWLKPFGYSDAINDAAINFILREFVMSKISSDSMMNTDMVVKLLRPQLEVTKEYNNTSKHLPSNIRHLTGTLSYQGLS